MSGLFDWFNELPSETKSMVALAGLATPTGAIYALQRWVFPDAPLVFIILGVAAVVAVLLVIAFALKSGSDG